jgi:hypothetical protein
MRSAKWPFYLPGLVLLLVSCQRGRDETALTYRLLKRRHEGHPVLHPDVEEQMRQITCLMFSTVFLFSLVVLTGCRSRVESGGRPASELIEVAPGDPARSQTEKRPGAEGYEHPAGEQVLRSETGKQT